MVVPHAFTELKSWSHINICSRSFLAWSVFRPPDNALCFHVKQWRTAVSQSWVALWVTATVVNPSSDSYFSSLLQDGHRADVKQDNVRSQYSNRRLECYWKTLLLLSTAFGLQNVDSINQSSSLHFTRYCASSMTLVESFRFDKFCLES